MNNFSVNSARDLDLEQAKNQKMAKPQLDLFPLNWWQHSCPSVVEAPTATGSENPHLSNKVFPI